MEGSPEPKQPRTATGAAGTTGTTGTTSAAGASSPTTRPDTSTRTSSPTGAPSASSPTPGPAGSAASASSPTPGPASSAASASNPTDPSPAFHSRLASWFGDLPPAAGSAVMATSIVSTGLRAVGTQVLSAVLFALAAIGWLALGDDFARRLARERDRWTAESHTPAALTAVASTTVLGVRVSLQGWQPPAVVLLIVAAVLWPPLLWIVVRHLRPNMQGAVFLVCVATQGLVTLAATLAAALPAHWLLVPALVLFVLGLVLYVDAMRHFDFTAVRNGAGDHWVAGGALAISALACAKLLAGGSTSGGWTWAASVHDTLRVIALILLALAWCWYAVLVVAEIRWPRPRYDVRRWATVFPMGMTAVATIEVAKATGWKWLTDPGHVLVWIGAAAWLLTFVGFNRQAAKRVFHGEPK